MTRVRDLLADRDEWRRQHENALASWQADLRALKAKQDAELASAKGERDGWHSLADINLKALQDHNEELAVVGRAAERRGWLACREAHRALVYDLRVEYALNRNALAAFGELEQRAAKLEPPATGAAPAEVLTATGLVEDGRRRAEPIK